jgi:transcriptional regulator GlxA family with amidase domain
MHGASVESAARILLLDRLRDPRAPQPRDDLFVDARDTLVRRALLFMRSNVATVCPVSAVADRMGCTPRQLQRRFLADVGVPPSQAYMALRIDAACTLLAKTEMAVEQIGLAVGFANASMFSRAFRRMRGCTPSNFRATATSPL